MPTRRPLDAGSRGPVRREPSARPSGYRVTDEVREELQMAAQFNGENSLQAIIGLAVDEFLKRQRRRPGFSQALVAARRAQKRIQ